MVDELFLESGIMGSNRHKILFNDQTFTAKEKWNFGEERVSIADKFCETGRSSIFVDEDNFYKLIKTKNFLRSNYRLLLGKSRAGSEVLGNRTLRELGLLVPELRYHGFSFLSKYHNEILIFEKLNDFVAVKDVIKNKNDNSSIKELLFEVVQQLNVLIRGDVLFRDFHFNNVMINSKGTLCWVDTSVRLVKNKQEMEYGINKKVRSISRQVANEKWLTESQWDFFKKNIELKID